MNQRLAALHEYPFTKLNRLLDGVKANADKSAISLAIGEPQHAPPACLVDALKANVDALNRYPTTSGEVTLRQAIAATGPATAKPWAAGSRP